MPTTPTTSELTHPLVATAVQAPKCPGLVAGERPEDVEVGVDVRLRAGDHRAADAGLLRSQLHRGRRLGVKGSQVQTLSARQ
jgi:hypothetical protein